MKHKCVVPDCPKLIMRDLLMCLDHWRQVPRAIQRDVYQTWREGPISGYLKARQAAIDSIRPPLPLVGDRGWLKR